MGTRKPIPHPMLWDARHVQHTDSVACESDARWPAERTNSPFLGTKKPSSCVHGVQQRGWLLLPPQYRTGQNSHPTQPARFRYNARLRQTRP